MTVSEDGQHFRAVIGENCVSVDVDDMGERGTEVYRGRPRHRDLEDSPEGPVIAIAG